jgi:hypothetical protein
MQLYIDANIYLEYFRENSAEGLAPLRELVKLIKGKQLRLLIPKQTRQEYFRNRMKIAELTRTALIKQSGASFILPATFDKNTPEIKDILIEVRNLERAYKNLVTKYDQAVEKQKTDADLLINELFDKLGENLPEEDPIIQKAYTRYMKGNPPRKSDHSYGDAIIWETLLAKGLGDNLVIISRDSDFMEKYKGEQVLNSFLAVEWRIKTKKKNIVKLYKSLAEFINSFNKKKPIKEKIVEKEERLGVVTNPEMIGLTNTATSIGNISSGTSYTVPLSGYAVPITQDLIFNSYINPTNYIHDKKCPSCQSSNVSRVNENMFYGISNFSYQCLSCGQKFTLLS